MADVLNTDVGNSDALGTVAEGKDRTGGAVVLPDAEISPDKVLWYSIQRQDQEQKRNQAAARKALSDLNDIKISGWANHLTELNQLKGDVLNQATSYLQKYKGKNWNEFDATNPQQTKEALALQQAIGKFKEAEAFSEQIKTQAQQGEETLRKNPKGYTQDSVDKWNDFLKKPIQQQMDYVAQNGSLPDFETHHNWRLEAIQAAKSVHDMSTSTTTDANGVLHTITNDAVLNKTATPTWDSFINSEGGQQAINEVAKENPKLSGDEILNKIRQENFDPVLGQYDAANDRYVRKSVYSERPDQVAISQGKEKAIVGEPVTVDKVVTAAPTDKQGAAYIPLKYGGRDTYFDQFAPITAKNDQQLKNFAGSVGEVYKVTKTNQGNFQTQSVSADEKANFHPAGVMVNSKTGEAALIMTAKNPKAVEPTDSQIKAQMTDAEYKEYINKDTSTETADNIYANARSKAIEKSTKGQEDVQYLAPIDASLESKYNTIVSQPLRTTFPSRKNWTQTKPSASKKTDPLGIL